LEAHCCLFLSLFFWVLNSFHPSIISSKERFSFHNCIQEPWYKLFTFLNHDLIATTNPKRITKLHTCHDDFGVRKQVNQSNVHKSGSELLGSGLTHLQSSPKFLALFVWSSLSPQQ
jgi:hypothetical protein